MNKRVLFFIAGIMGLFLCAGCANNETDVQLTHRIFNGLCNGNRSVENFINWDTLKAVGVNVGQAYSNIISAKEREDYRKAFFYNFAFSFKAAHGKASGLTNWRVQNRTGVTTVIAADTAMGKSLFFTLGINKNKRQLIDIEWQK